MQHGLMHLHMFLSLNYVQVINYPLHGKMTCMLDENQYHSSHHFVFPWLCGNTKNKVLYQVIKKPSVHSRCLCIAHLTKIIQRGRWREMTEFAQHVQCGRPLGMSFGLVQVKILKFPSFHNSTVFETFSCLEFSIFLNYYLFLSLESKIHEISFSSYLINMILLWPLQCPEDCLVTNRYQ
jgi:hypothetical protein